MGQYAKKSWRKFQTDKNKHLVTDESIDLLDKCLIYDHQNRISCKEALAHPYFDPVRPGSTTKTKSEDEYKEKKEKEKEKERHIQLHQTKKNDDDTDTDDSDSEEEEGLDKPKLPIPFQGKARA